MNRTRKNKQPVNQFGIYYMTDSRVITNWKRFSSAAGFSNNLDWAIGRACWHIGRNDYYPKAVIVDRLAEKIIRVIHRTASGISIIERE